MRKMLRVEEGPGNRRGERTGNFVYAVAAPDGDSVLHGLADSGLRLRQSLQSGLLRGADAAMPSPAL